MIKYLCLIYLNDNKDAFDSQNTHKDIVIDGNYIKFVRRDLNNFRHQKSSTFLSNVVNSGVNIWKFRCNKYIHDLVGIRKVEQELVALTRWFDKVIIMNLLVMDIFFGMFNKSNTMSWSR